MLSSVISLPSNMTSTSQTLYIVDYLHIIMHDWQSIQRKYKVNEILRNEDEFLILTNIHWKYGTIWKWLAISNNLAALTLAIILDLHQVPFIHHKSKNWIKAKMIKPIWIIGLKYWVIIVFTKTKNCSIWLDFISSDMKFQPVTLI